MADVVIRSALERERSTLEALQWRASLANAAIVTFQGQITSVGSQPLVCRGERDPRPLE